MKELGYNNTEVIFMNRSFPVLYEQDEDGYIIATCPVLEGCYSQGKTLEEASENIKEAIKLCLKELDEEEIPNKKIFFGEVVVP